MSPTLTPSPQVCTCELVQCGQCKAGCPGEQCNPGGSRNMCGWGQMPTNPCGFTSPPTTSPTVSPTFVPGSPTPEPTSTPTYLPRRPTPVPTSAPTYIVGSPTLQPTSTPTYLPGKPTPVPTSASVSLRNSNFEQDGPFSYWSNWRYMCPTGWSCGGGTVLIGESSWDWQHASNVNGGAIFLGIQGSPSYIQQELQLDPKTLFSVSFDSSYRLNSCNTILDVYCNDVTILSFQPSSTWSTTSSLCQTDDLGKATIKFSNSKSSGDCTVFIDNVDVTGFLYYNQVLHLYHH